MANTAINGTRVIVRKWSSTYLVPNTHPNPARIRDRLDASVHDDLPAALASPMTALLAGQDDELIFVRRLELDFSVDAGWDRDAIAAQCAQALGSRLARELLSADSTNVIRFTNRAAYLARFLADRSTGDAGSRWYYARFGGLRHLPCGAALRTALLDDVDLGLDALRSLTENELACVIAALGDNEGARICSAMSARSPDGDDAGAFATIIAMARGAPHGSISSASGLALWWIARSDMTATRSLFQAAHAIAAMTLALRSERVSTDLLLRAIADRDAAALATLARIDADAALYLRECPAALLRDLLAKGKALSVTESTSEFIGSTSFGGGFVLLDDLFALPIEQVTRGWPALESIGADQVLRFLILGSCSGGARATSVFADPLWRRLFGIPPTITRRAVADWLSALGPICRRRFARALTGRAAQPVATQQQRLRDRHGRWYRVVVEDDGSWRMLHCLPAMHAGQIDGEPDEDIDFLLADGDPLLPRAWSLLLALPAQHVLRRFLRRLLGFSASHLTYAQRNLLEFSASIDAQAERIVVRLTRPPLGLILNFAGCNRGVRTWPSLDVRPFALFNDG